MTQQFRTLSNGFRIVTEAMPGLQSASVGLWVEAGGRHEAPEQNGIAHFLEHMAFKGTKRRSALRIAEEIEDVGGYINAYTSREMTAYYARILKGDEPWPAAPEDRDLTYFLTQSLRDLLVKELPPREPGADARELSQQARTALKALARIDGELAQLVITENEAGQRVPDWFVLDIARDLPRLAEPK